VSAPSLGDVLFLATSEALRLVLVRLGLG